MKYQQAVMEALQVIAVPAHADCADVIMGNSKAKRNYAYRRVGALSACKLAAQLCSTPHCAYPSLKYVPLGGWAWPPYHYHTVMANKKWHAALVLLCMLQICMRACYLQQSQAACIAMPIG